MNLVKAEFILRLGEYFLEAHCPLAPPQAPQAFSTSYYIPKTSVAQALEHLSQNFPLTKTPQNIFLDLPFLNSLLGYSLGGSVAQIRTEQTDALLKLTLGTGETTAQDDDAASMWGAQNLNVVLSESQMKQLPQELPTTLEQLKAKGAKRIVLQIATDEISPEVFELFQNSCRSLELVPFPRTSENLNYRRFVQNLMDASLWGRYLENTQNLMEHVQTFFPKTTLFFVVDQKPMPIDQLENFLPSQLLDHQWCEKVGKPVGSKTLSSLYVGWESMKWITPLSETDCSLSLTSLLHVDQIKQIEFINTQLKMSPGPMCFGRGSKLMVLDFLAFQQAQAGKQVEIPGIDIKSNLSKVEQALQNLWRLSSLRSGSFSVFLNEVQQTVDDHLHTEFLHHKSMDVVGPLAFLFNSSGAKLS